MNTKSFNYFRNTFALIGFFIIACSVTESTDEPEQPVLNNYGKYQVSLGVFSTNGLILTSLNTETGALRTYQLATGVNQQGWVEYDELSAGISGRITFTH